MQTLSNLSYFLRSCIDKATHNKRSDTLHKFLNKMSGQIWDEKSQTTYNLKRKEYRFDFCSQMSFKLASFSKGSRRI